MLDQRPRAAATPPDAPTGRHRYRERPGPWRRRDLTVCGLLAAIGVAGIVACWFDATEEAVWREQMGWAIGGVVFSGLVLLAGGLWVLVGLREVRRALRELHRDQRAAFGLTRVRGAASPAAPGPIVLALVTAAGMTRAHRADCLLMRGKHPVPAPDALPSCGICEGASES